jgi:ribosome biogenesis ATPase
LVAKAIANESGASFLSIKGPELLNQYVGESERAVRKVFQRARASAPCVIFFDELDALVPKRGGGGNEGGGSQVSERVVNQLLTEMDGLEERRFVFVIAATNRPDMIDPAMLRPGRLDKLLYVQLPSAAERAAILRKHLRRTPLSADVDVVAVAADPRAEGFSGADVAALCREATLQALREAQTKQRNELLAKGLITASTQNSWASLAAASAKNAANNTAGANGAAGAGAAAASSAPSFNAAPLPVLVSMAHFGFAFSKVFPSVSHASKLRYDRMHAQLCRARSTLSNDGPTAAVPAAAAKASAQQPNHAHHVATIQEEQQQLDAEEAAEDVARSGATAPVVSSSSPTVRTASSVLMPPPSAVLPPKSLLNMRTTAVPTSVLTSFPQQLPSAPAATTAAAAAGTILGHLTASGAAPTAAGGSSHMETQ